MVGSGDHDKMAESQQATRFLPRLKLAEGVHADDKKEHAAWALFLEGRNGVNGVRPSGAAHFYVAKRKAGPVGQCQMDHLGAVMGGGHRLLLFVGRVTRRDEPHLIQPEPPPRRLGDVKVAVVDGIEGATQQTHAAWGIARVCPRARVFPRFPLRHGGHHNMPYPVLGCLIPRLAPLYKSCVDTRFGDPPMTPSSPGPGLVLASTSPRRAEILARLGLPFKVVAPRFEETPDATRSARDEAGFFAEAKARSVTGDFPNHLIIGSDTLIDRDGEKIGKPADAAEARRLLRRLRGRSHTIWTAVALLSAARDAAAPQVEVSVAQVTVSMRWVDDLEIDRYVATGEPLDKAGAYAIQGGASAWIERIEGDRLAAIGLWLVPIEAHLKRAGIPFCPSPQIPQSPLDRAP